MIEIIKERLSHLSPLKLEITDQSHLHQGHAGNSGGGHYTLTITSASFTQLKRMQRHRLIYDALADLIPSKIHALSIKALAPDE